MRSLFLSFLWGWRQLWTRRSQAIGQVILVAVGLGALMSVDRLHNASESTLISELEGIDLVLAAPGSPTQALLSSIFHLDEPTGNIDSSWANSWMRHPEVQRALPMAYGDYAQGVRILGCTPEFYTWKNVELKSGRLPRAPFEALAGIQAAQRLGLVVGDEFHGSHGTEGDAGDHAHQPYTVVGIGDARGTAVDGLLMTPLESVWHVHPEAPADYTAVLLEMRSPQSALFFPRMIRAGGKAMAVSPPLEINRLRSLLDQSSFLFTVMSLMITAVSSVALVLMGWNFAEERRAELALLRANGADLGSLYGFVAAPFLAVLVFGWGVGWAAQAWWYVPNLPLDWSPLTLTSFDAMVLLYGAAGAGLLAVLPVVKMMRTPIHTALLDA